MPKNKNFKLKRSEKIASFGVELIELEHQSGAKIFYFKNADKNRMFAINFTTIPESDKGEPHILEHSVFMGSENFDLGGKEPFADLVRKRMATYLNAYTMPDSTTYPVASVNKDDFLYMMRLYLDAVFKPNILKDKNIFRQEAWRLEKDANGSYMFSGVVLGEMKSRLSSAQAIFYRKLVHKLFPQSVYSKESGGDPNEIINLSYKELINFYKKYYTAKNAKIFLYGAQDTKAFDLLDEYLSGAKKGKEYKIKLSTPKRKRKEKITLPGDAKKDSACSVSFYTEPARKIKENLILSIIFSVISFDKSSPIKKAFYESGIKATPVFEFEYYTKINNANFIFFGADKKDLKSLQRLIFEALQKIKKEGLNKERLQKEIEKQELFFAKMKFADNKGERLLSFAQKFWIYGADLFEALKIRDILREIQKEFKEDPKLFDRYFAKYFADSKNPLVLEAAAKDMDPFAKLKQKERALSRASKKEKEKFEKQIKEFAEFKKKEAKTKISASNLAKYKGKAKDWTKEVQKSKNFYFNKIHSDLFSANLFFDLSHLSLKELQELSALICGFNAFSFDGISRDKMDKQIAGVLTGPSFAIVHVGSKNKAKSFLRVSFDFLQKNKNLAKQIIEAHLYKMQIDKKVLLREIRENFENAKDALRYFSSARVFAQTRALAPFSLQFALEDLTEGLSFFEFLNALFKDFCERSCWEKLYKKAFSGKVFVTFSAKDFDKSFFDFLQKPSYAKECARKNPFKKESVYFFVPHKGFYTNALASSTKLSGASLALSALINYDYYWHKIREEGGAYGASLNSFLHDELFVNISHSDPSQERSFKIFESLEGFDLEDFDKDDLQGAVASKLLRFDIEKNALSYASSKFLLDASGLSFDKEMKKRQELLFADKSKLQKELQRIKSATKKECVKISLGGVKKPEIKFDKIIKLDF